MMRNTYYQIYVHIVWCTKNRELMINEEVESNIHSIINEKANKHKANTVAIGNTLDHIHLLLSISPETSIAMLIKEIKGSSSFFINHKTKQVLYWQDGYGALSVSKFGLEKVKMYVENQKTHHKVRKDIIEILEKCSVE